MNQIQLSTYAKINLSLDVTGLREDGYHEVAMVMQAIDLKDHLTIHSVERADGTEAGKHRLPGEPAVSRDGGTVPGAAGTGVSGAPGKSGWPQDSGKWCSMDGTETDTPCAKPVIRLTMDVPGIPLDRRNTAYRAAELMLERLSECNPGRYGKLEILEIRIEKRIPSSAGLAGGSSNAAGVLAGMNRLLEMHLSLDELCEMGTRIGADVPFCIHSVVALQPELLQEAADAAGRKPSSCALAEGIGEKLTPLKPAGMQVLLANPGIEVSTAQVYRALDAISGYPRPDTEAVMDAVRTQSVSGLASATANVLENVTLRDFPAVNELKTVMMQCAVTAADTATESDTDTAGTVATGEEAGAVGISAAEDDGTTAGTVTTENVTTVACTAAEGAAAGETADADTGLPVQTKPETLTMMSGSGSTVFTLFSDRAAAQAAERALRKTNLGQECRIFLVRTL